MKKKDWIAASKRKPNSSRGVIVNAPNCNIIGNVLIGNYYEDSDTWTVHDFSQSVMDTHVTHWMEIVKPY